MINATELKNGTAFLYQGKPYQVVRYEHTKMGRGGATVRVTARNLESGGIQEKSFSSNLSFDEVSTHKTKLQYLYKDGRVATFMDPVTYEQSEIPLSVLGDQVSYVKEGDTINVFFWDDKPLSFELPPKVMMAVTQTDPGVKGNSAANIYKSATLENGLTVKVPLFINQGDKILIDTRTGDYLERAK